MRLVLVVLSLISILLAFAPTPTRALDFSFVDGSDESTETEVIYSFINNAELVTQENTEMEAISIAIDSNDYSGYVSTKADKISEFYSSLSGQVKEKRELIADRNRLVAFLARQKSPVATNAYAEQIITLSKQNGIDYRMIVAIMGTESGFCAANYKTYNCFGYLNGVQYGSYSQAFSALIPRIANEYVKVYGTNFSALAKAYGIHNVEYHSQRMANYYHAI